MHFAVYFAVVFVPDFLQCESPVQRATSPSSNLPGNPLRHTFESDGLGGESPPGASLPDPLPDKWRKLHRPIGSKC